MRRVAALFLTLVLFLNLGFAVVKAENIDTTDNDTQEVCETADECVENITAGWNLGCSLSAFSKETIDAWGVMVYFLTPDRLYSRSEICSFDASSKTAEIAWQLGQNGILQVYDGALVDGIGIELCNYGMGEGDQLTYRIDELTYVTAENEVILNNSLGTYQTDMSGGTGGGIVADLENCLVTDIAEIRAKVTFIELSHGEVTPESIIEAETSWGNPVTTKDMIMAVRDRGFNLVRVQVSWLNHMDDNGNIDQLWLDRVAEVVDYCMDAGVYCLINTSGGGWLTAERDTFTAQSAVYQRLWEQIAARFANYGELLLFESCNEVLTSNDVWWYPPTEAYDVMNDLYQIFVDTVRASGGYNATRNLVLNPYAATYDYTMNSYFRLPEDTVDNHLIAQVHCYAPMNFCVNEINLGSTDFVNEWGSEEEKSELDRLLGQVKTRFVDELGIPVIVGEFGTVDRLAESERTEYVNCYAQTAKKYGIKLVIFDDGGDFAVFDRNTLTWPYEEMIDVLIENASTNIDIPVVEPVTNPLPDWSAMAYFSGADGSYNRSPVFSFDNTSKTAEIIWTLGEDEGIINADNDTTIDAIGVELWNFTMTEDDIISYTIDEVKYITKNSGEVIIPAEESYGSNMSDGTGGGLFAETENLLVSEVRAIVLKVTLNEIASIPEVTPVTNPIPEWNAMAYFIGTDNSYNRSPAFSFDSDSKTAEIVWVLGDDTGVINASEVAGVESIGIELWNFNLTEDDIVKYRIDELKYITMNNCFSADSVLGSYGTNMSDGTGGGLLVDIGEIPVSSVRAIVMKVSFDGIVEMPVAEAVTNPLPDWSAVAYLTGVDNSYSRSAVTAFDNDTKTAEIIWYLDDNTGIVNADVNTIVNSIGVELWNFSLSDTDAISYSIDEMRYITRDNEIVVDTAIGIHETDMSDGTGGGTLTTVEDIAVGNLRAIIITLTLVD